MYTSQIISPIPMQNAYVLPQTQQFIQVPQVPQIIYPMAQPQPIPMTQEQIASAYARYIPPTPTTSTSTPPKIYQFYKYVDVAQVKPIQQVPQYQTITVPVVNNGNYIIQ